MTLDRFRPLADRAIDPFVDAASRLGLTPNSVSVLAMAVATAAGLCFLFARREPWLYAVGAGFVFLNGWLDILDGALARELAVDSPAGDLLDHVLDRYADIVIVVGLSGGIERYALGTAAVTGVLMTSYLGTQAQAVGLDRVYGGALGRADRLALVGLGAALMSATSRPVAGLTAVGWLLSVLAVVGHLTALQRFYHSVRSLS
jgi:Phosphatidylglycerophosphate synthase